MASFITPFFSYATVLSHGILVALVIVGVSHRSWGKPAVEFIGRRAVLFGFLAAFVAVVGSLSYSLIVGYEPCELCWWQRIFLFPQAVLFAVALYRRDGGIFSYTVPLSVLAGIIALYHTYIQLGGSKSILPCTATGSACAKVFVNDFGYVTIPTMALTVALYILLFAWYKHLYKRV